MKTIRNLFLGLIIAVIPLFATNGHAATKSNKKNHAVKPTLIKKKKKVDALEAIFTYTATETAPGYYRIDVTFNDYDITAGTMTAGPCPTTVNILITSGPFSGYGFDFPSGTTTYTVATIAYPSNPSGYDFTITTNPTVINVWPIDQHLIGGAIE